MNILIIGLSFWQTAIHLTFKIIEHVNATSLRKLIMILYKYFIPLNTFTCMYDTTTSITMQSDFAENLNRSIQILFNLILRT